VEFDVARRFQRGWVTIRKRKRSGRVLLRPLRPSTARLVRKLLAASDAPQPFATVDRTTLYCHLNRLLTRAGLPVDRKHKFHCMRRSHASYLTRAGGDAQDSLDHGDPNMVRERYHDPRVTVRKQAIDYLFDPSGWRDRLLAMLGW
jgi:integrase